MPNLVEQKEVCYQALSLGAGVQSSVLALLLSEEDSELAEQGYRKPDIAIFADTGWEPEYVYEHLEWLEEKLDFPLIRVSDGNIKKNVKKGITPSGHAFIDIPFYLVNEDGKKGMLWRQCTNHYKIRPILRHVREMAGGQRGRPFPKNQYVEMWLGISMDEVTRMKPSRGTVGGTSLAFGGYWNVSPGLHRLVYRELPWQTLAPLGVRDLPLSL